ncbi:MAG TPA: antitoxin family protein [Verrucomicrobiae bacterium]
MKTIHATYEQGIFRPHESVELPERTELEFEPKVVGEKEPCVGDMRGIIEVMSRSYHTGQRVLAARHNEHQP